MTTLRLDRGRAAVCGAALVLVAAACGGKFESAGPGTGGTAGTGASNGSGGSAGTGATGGTAGVSGSGGRAGSSGASGSAGTQGSSGVGGTGGTSGASGASGSGGSGGSGTCSGGAACSDEGATCSEPGCCPCLYTCVSGRWQISACPSCPGPSCDPVPPTHGAACNECFSPPDGCSYDGCPSQPRVFALCQSGTWNVQASPCSGGCCDSDPQCGPGYLCVSTVCKAQGGPGCWRDVECGPGYFCSGAFVCPCNADCAYADSMGQCVPNGIGCCRSDAECGTDGGRCVAGVCKPKPADGSCWNDRDCLGAPCRNAQVCPCGVACAAPDMIGQCGL